MTAAGDPHGLGYRQVEGDENLAFLVASMDATSAWSATRALRAWEAERLALGDGDRCIDVGCGPGDALVELARSVGATGELVGVDASAAMVDVARTRARRVLCRSRFVVGDALALDEPDGSFDAARCERTLQWVDDPARAVGELARVLRPGGRIGLIDTDWSTLRLDVGDDRISIGVRESLRVERSRPSHVGSRLVGLLARGGFDAVAATAATQVWTRWDPDASPTPDGCFSMAGLADELVGAGQLSEDERAWFVQTVHEAARDDRFVMTLTMFAASGVKPGAR